MKSKEFSNILETIHKLGRRGEIEAAFKKLQEIEASIDKYNLSENQFVEATKRLKEMRVLLCAQSNDDPENTVYALLDLLEQQGPPVCRDCETVLIGLRSILKSI